MEKRFSPEKGPDPFFRAAGLALVLTLLVVAAAAGIRHGVDASLLRPVHRVAATLVVPVALWMAWKSFRPATVAALALTAILSVVGILGGKNPPAWIAATNLLGGLLLAAVFARILGKRFQGPFSGKRFQGPFFLILVLQVSLGAWISVSGSVRMLPLHGLLAMLVAALLAWFALARVRGVAGKILFAAALAAPVAGMTSLQYEHSAIAALVHAAAAALLVSGAAYAFARRA